jgi:Tfp pilus assembly protein PilX
MHKQSPKSSNQSGLVSILVTMIIMIVLSLIILGFAKLTRREQRQSLDRQLYSQAAYAAETGVNDAQQYVKAVLAAGAAVPTIDRCDAGNPNSFPAKATAYGIATSIGNNIAYSCTLLNPSPTELIWQRVDSQNSVAFPFKPTAAITGITFAWQDGDSVATTYGGCPNTVPASGAFKPQTSWSCQAGALRVDLTPISGLWTRTSLVDTTQNFILYPVQTGGPTTTTYASLGHGGIIAAGCNATTTPRHCQVTVTGASGSYFIRIKPIYRAANLQISAEGGTTTLTGAQAIVDVTGKASDILRRLQVRIPISNLSTVTNTTFDSAIQSIDSLCKLYAIIPGATPPVINTDSTSDASCDL